jgi:hypothetical protein
MKPIMPGDLVEAVRNLEIAVGAFDGVKAVIIADEAWPEFRRRLHRAMADAGVTADFKEGVKKVTINGVEFVREVK